MSPYKNHAGAWVFTGWTRKDARYLCRAYYGYTKREALRLFREEVRRG